MLEGAPLAHPGIGRSAEPSAGAALSRPKGIGAKVSIEPFAPAPSGIAMFSVVYGTVKDTVVL